MATFSNLILLLLSTLAIAAPSSKASTSSTTSSTKTSSTSTSSSSKYSVNTKSCPPFTSYTTTTTVTYAPVVTTRGSTSVSFVSSYLMMADSLAQTYTVTIYPSPSTTSYITDYTTTIYTGPTSTITPYTYLVYTLVVPPANKTVSKAVSPLTVCSDTSEFSRQILGSHRCCVSLSTTERLRRERSHRPTISHTKLQPPSPLIRDMM